MPLILTAPYLKKILANIGDTYERINSFYLPLTSDLLDVTNTANVTNSGVRISTNQFKFPDGSAYFDGNSYLSLPASAGDANFKEDFTLECWIYPEAWPTSDGSQSSCLVGQYKTDGSAYNILNIQKVGVNFACTANGKVSVANNPTQPSLRQWTHIAAVKLGTTVKVYVNGIGGPAVDVSASVTGEPLWVGRLNNATKQIFKGFIQNLRLTRRAVYTGNFTPPTKPLSKDVLKYQDWTVAWFAKSDIYANTDFLYDIPLPEIQKATRAAIAYFNSTTSGEITVTAMHSFDLPEDWKTQHPMSYSGRILQNVSAKNEASGQITVGDLYYGYESWSTSYLYGPWAAASLYGRLGVTNTRGPFYSGYSSVGSDYCSLGDEFYNATPSTPTRRFIILVK